MVVTDVHLLFFETTDDDCRADCTVRELPFSWTFRNTVHVTSIGLGVGEGGGTAATRVRERREGGTCTCPCEPVAEVRVLKELTCKPTTRITK